jgi:type III secretory pathway component EscS
MDLLTEHMGKGIIIMLLLSMPTVLVAAVVGLVIGVIQAVTQVQEQTIVAAPKIFGVFLVIMLLGGFSIKTLNDYFMESSNIAFNIIPRDEEMVLPPSNDYSKGAKIFEEEYFGEKKPKIRDIMKSPGKVPLADEKYKQSYIKTPKNISYPPNFIEGQKIKSGK